MSTINGTHNDAELDGIRLKKSVSNTIPVMNGQTNGTGDDDEVIEDVSQALQLLKSSYDHKDGVSIEVVSFHET